MQNSPIMPVINQPMKVLRVFLIVSAIALMFSACSQRVGCPGAITSTEASPKGA